jgi:hypothetical protein
MLLLFRLRHRRKSGPSCVCAERRSRSTLDRSMLNQVSDSIGGPSETQTPDPLIKSVMESAT